MAISKRLALVFVGGVAGFTAGVCAMSLVFYDAILKDLEKKMEP